MFDVKGYGAVGDGVADDAAAIQHAIDTAATVGGGTVLMPAGTYRLESPLTIPAGAAVVLTGDGMNTTLLSFRGGGAAIRVGAPAAVEVDVDARQLLEHRDGLGDLAELLEGARQHL